MGQDCCSNREPTDKDGKKKESELLDRRQDKQANPNEAQKNPEATSEKVKAKLGEIGSSVKNYDYKGAADKVKNYDYKKAAQDTKEAAANYDYKGAAARTGEAIKNYDYKGTADAVKNYDYKGAYDGAKNHQYTQKTMDIMATMKQKISEKIEEQKQKSSEQARET